MIHVKKNKQNYNLYSNIKKIIRNVGLNTVNNSTILLLFNQVKNKIKTLIIYSLLRGACFKLLLKKTKGPPLPLRPLLLPPL